MTKTLIKFLFRKIKKSLGGFITISIIVTLGVGFLVGLLLTTPDLQSSVQQMYEEHNVADITLKSTIGFDFNTVEKLEDLMVDQVDAIEGSYQIDEHVYYNEEKIAARKIYYSEETLINKIDLIEGELPKNEFECVVEAESIFMKPIHIGEEILIDENTYKVTGIAANPQYFSQEKEYTTISPGRLDTIIYLNNEFNTNDFYTDINIVLKDSKNYNTFSDEYFEFIDSQSLIISQNKEELLKDRYENIKLQVYEEVYKGFYDSLVERVGETIANELMKTETVQTEINIIVEEQMKNFSSEIYILDREDNTSFYIYKIQSVKTNDVAFIFPFFFIAIAALITLSTLERMIKEDRIYIGTLKSLGFKNKSIMNVYITYSLIATFIGVILGLAFGIVALPSIIYFIFTTLYRMPGMVFVFDPLMFVIISLSILLAVLFATLFTMRNVLKEKPNALLTQKPIKAGGKILLEKIGFIWKKLKFKYKATCRNIFRFKKNGLMMIVGIAGSTALVLAAFGMMDSISAVTEIQYNDIVIYNTLVTVNDYEINPFENYQNVEKQDIIYKIAAEAQDNSDFELEIISPFKDTDLNSYINFIEDGKEIEFNENSTYISFQLSQMLNIQKDDVFFFMVDDKQYSVLVNGVVENHIFNYLYLSENNFKKIFENKYEPNCYMAICNNIETEAKQEEFIINLSEDPNVKEVNLTYQNKQSYDNLLSTLQMMIIVLIIFAGLLEITSIYSLTDISVSERNRELATLKVLGYRKREVVGYVYRETTILAIIGTLLGLFIGFFFHKAVVRIMQFAGLSIGYVISPLSYFLAIIISMVFFGLVDLVFFPKINKINMTESLKSVE